ncbi:MAG: glycosyltransferase [Candidatus Saccharibacteria bacterium]|nr:glycosyltransferase [Candidatus Saccharibacteria bacterium]
MSKRITWIINDITQVGGIERVVCNLSNYFQQNDCTIKIVSLNTKEGTPHFKLAPNIAIEHLSYPADEILNRKKLKTALADFLKNESDKSDILITCHPWIAMPILQQKSLYSGRIFCTEHATWESYSKIRRILNAHYYKRADKFIVLTENAKQIYQKHGVKNPAVIPNIITNYPEKTAPLISKELVAAGRLTAIKGYDRLIEAVAIIKDDFAPWHLTIYGDGEEHDRLVDLIHQNHLEKLIAIKNFTDDLPKQLLTCSAYLLSSHSEAFPMVALESLSSGLPIISFDIPSLREIDNNTNTIIFAEQDNIADLANKIKSFISSSDIQKRGIASRKLSENYSLEKIGKKWLKLFN